VDTGIVTMMIIYEAALLFVDIIEVRACKM